LALDTGSRSLDQVYRRCTASSGGEIKLLLDRKTELLALTTSLLDSCSDSTLRAAGVGEVNLSEVINRFKVFRHKISVMDGDGGAGSFMNASYSNPNSSTGWQAQSIGSFGWEPPSMQGMMVPFEESQNTFEGEQHGFMRDDQAFMDEMSSNMEFFGRNDKNH
jgi:hypothetical protein